MIKVQQHGPVTAIRMSRTLFGRPVYWTAAYWVDGLLIDSGPLSTAAELVQVLESVEVRQVVVTHGHEDAIGGLSALRRRFPRAQIYANWHTVPVIEDPDALQMQFYRRWLWGKPLPVADVVPVPDLLQTPEYTFRVVETPGHSRDHISLFEPDQRWVFCGDAFVGGQERAWAADVELFGVVSSLRTLAALRPERLYPGSGNVRRTPQPELQGKVAHYVSLCEKVRQLDAQQLSTARIVRELLGGEPRFTFLTRGHISATNLIQACRSYNALVDPASLDLPLPLPARPGRHSAPFTGDLSTGEPSDYSDLSDLIR